MTTTTAAQLPRPMSWALGSGTILQGLNSAVLAVALVSIGADLGTGPATAWIVSALYLSAAVCSPTGGRLADLFGPRRVYLVGLAITLVASVAGPFVPSLEWLVADRFLLGVGTALQFPTAMAIIRREAQRRRTSPASALGVIALCGQTTAALGPAVGGPIVAVWGWEGIFWVNVPMVANAAFWVLRTVPADPPRASVGFVGTLRAIDPVGLVAFVATLATLMLGLLSLETGARWWWFVAAAVGVVVLVLWSARSPQPFLDVRLLTRNPALWRTCVRAMVTFVSFYTIFYGLPQWLEASRGLGPVGAGLLMVPVFGVGVVSTVVATRLGSRVPAHLLLVVGGAAMVAAGALAVWAVTVDSPVWLFVLLGGLLGLPNGFNNIGNQLQLHSAVEQQQAGVASGLYRTSQYVGAALAAVVVAAGVTPGGDDGIHALGAWVGGIGLLLVLLSLAALLVTRRSTAR
ncbi:MFS transporter [Isoptericola haloaureus]|uniref:MFS transporter n=1 Tax=Isoptericola haloaureus TaxID=1542902 RepID=A0ABU7Z4G3_9MICO